MGLMNMLGGLLGRKAPKSGNGLLDSLLPMLLKGGGGLGGLAGLLGKFRGAGMGGKVDSWVSTGENEPLDASEVERALGTDTVGSIAKSAGMTHDQASSGLASMLPKLVDGMTPGGAMPSGGLGKIAKNLDFGKILGGLG
jgi:uncharacterized protein YidB (DUF937 family)